MAATKSMTPSSSEVARLLASGFPFLRFSEPLESEFRADHRARMRGWNRVAIWMSACTVLGYAILDHFVLSADHARITNFVRFGNSGIVPSGEPEPVVDRLDAGVAQGFLEESNVNPVLEITRLIMVQRAFENGAAMIRDTESSYDEAIKTLGSG